MEPETLEPELLHRFKNQLGLALGFCNILLDEVDGDHPHRADLLQIQGAIHTAMALLPELAKQTK